MSIDLKKVSSVELVREMGRRMAPKSIPSEWNRERSERTADNANPLIARITVALNGGSHIREVESILSDCRDYIIRTSSPPASASMSAGVTDAMRAAAYAAYRTCESGDEAVCVYAALEAAERARANTRAGVELFDKLHEYVATHHDGEPETIELLTECHCARAARTAGDAKGAG